MAERNTPIRVLVVDDEPEIRDAYGEVALCARKVACERQVLGAKAGELGRDVRVL